MLKSQSDWAKDCQPRKTVHSCYSQVTLVSTVNQNQTDQVKERKHCFLINSSFIWKQTAVSLVKVQFFVDPFIHPDLLHMRTVSLESKVTSLPPLLPSYLPQSLEGFVTLTQQISFWGTCWNDWCCHWSWVEQQFLVLISPYIYAFFLFVGLFLIKLE